MICILVHCRRQLGDMRQRMRRFQRRDDPLGPDAAGMPPATLASSRSPTRSRRRCRAARKCSGDPRIIQPRADRVRLDDLSIIVLQQVGRLPAAPGRPPVRLAACSPLSMPWPPACCRSSRTDGSRGTDGTAPLIRPAADARHPPHPAADLCRLQLRLRLPRRSPTGSRAPSSGRMRAGDGADQIVGVLDIGDPVAQRLVHRVLQRGRPRGHRLHLRAQQLHAGTRSAPAARPSVAPM